MKKTPPYLPTVTRQPRRSSRPTRTIRPWSAGQKAACMAVMGVVLGVFGIGVRNFLAKRAADEAFAAREDRAGAVARELARAREMAEPDAERMLRDAVGIEDLARGTRWEAEIARQARFACERIAFLKDRAPRRALLGALEDPGYVAAHPLDALRALRMLDENPHASDDADFRARLERAQAAAAAHAGELVQASVRN